MPLTPFHQGPTLFLGLLLFPALDLPTFLIASVVIDIEPGVVLFLGLDAPLHGLSHSFLGGSVVAAILALAMARVLPLLRKMLDYFRLRQDHSAKSIWLASFSGIYPHILFDSPLYADIRPFYPLSANPLYNPGVSAGAAIYLLCAALFALGIGLYAFRALRR